MIDQPQLGDGGKQAMYLTVGIDPAQLRQLELDLQQLANGLPRVLTRGINKVAVSARSEVVKAVAGRINVTQTELRTRNIDLTKANFDRLQAVIRITGRRIPLLSFEGTRQTRVGVSYAVTRGSRRVVGSSFMETRDGKPVTMESGHTGVFARKPEAKHKLNRKGQLSQLPIVELFGPSVPQVVTDLPEFAQQVLEQRLGEKLAREIMTQAGLVLGGGKTQGETE